MINAYNRSEIENISFVSSKNLDRIKFKQRMNIHDIKMPKYFGVFFNQNQSKVLSDKNIRLALSHATDRKSLIEKIINKNGTIVNSPLLGEILDINKNVKIYEYNKELAVDILNASGWDEKDENGIRMKDDEKLSLKLTTSTWPELIETANNIKAQWLQIGVEVNIEILPTPEMQQAIKERNYQMFLFGEILSLDPDPFILWHSSQKKDPGLNLALYDNKSADILLEEARQTLNPLERAEKYDDFQKLVIEDIPAIFLYSPTYLYGQTKTIKGFDNKVIPTPSGRFSNIETWFIETKRIWK